MNAELIAIGTELLLGYVVSENTAYLARTLAGLGISCYRHVTVGDNPDRLQEAIETALSRADLVITCGGLGPTVDDITLETIARTTASPLILNRKILNQIRCRFRQRAIRMPKSASRQALLPQGAVVLPNRVGTAPGFLLKIGTWYPTRKSVPGTSRPTGQRLPADDSVAGANGPTGQQLLVALPGPPWELIPMVEEHLIRHLKPYAGRSVIQSRTLKITGVSEPVVDEKVRDLLTLSGATTLGIYASPGEVKLRITAKGENRARAQRAIAAMERTIRRRLGNLIYGVEEETLEAVVGRLLKARRLTIGVAESCTGGLVQHRLTQVPGSSAFFLGGMVTYADRLKETCLGVPERLLKRYGAVSADVAHAMAEGVRFLTRAKLGLSLTGIAGPTGGIKRKPVGLVYVGFSTASGTKVYRHHFPGSRSIIQFRASQEALDWVRRYCLKTP